MADRFVEALLVSTTAGMITTAGMRTVEMQKDKRFGTVVHSTSTVGYSLSTDINSTSSSLNFPKNQTMYKAEWKGWESSFC